MSEFDPKKPFERVTASEEARNRVLITTVRVIPGPAHDLIKVWNRGGLAGQLIVNAGDGVPIARALLPDAKVNQIAVKEE